MGESEGSRRIYFFGAGESEGHAGMRELLGGKGADLAEMTRLGIPVPPGFTITTEACRQYFEGENRLPEPLVSEIEAALARLEKVTGKRFGDARNPLLVSVRSGSRVSMPGMMDTILNLGLDFETTAGLASLTGDGRFAWDCFRRLIQMYGNVVLGLGSSLFEKALEETRHRSGAPEDSGLSAAVLEDLTRRYLAIVRGVGGVDFPLDSRQQLLGAVGAVFRSWRNERAVTYRKLHRIPEDWGTAVSIQSMVFGNRGETSATGVAFTRNPATGERRHYGEYLPNAQGEDVVAGIRTPRPLSRGGASSLPSLEETMPATHRDLLEIFARLERHYQDMLDIEFTVEEGKLYILQSRRGKRTGFASVRCAVEMVEEGLIDPATAVGRVEPEQLTQLLAPIFEPAEKQRALESGRILARGLNAGPGAASGKAALSAERVVEMASKGEKVILVRLETSPEDIAGMAAAEGILTARGGMTSHAAVVARGMGKVCVVGCSDLAVDPENRTLRFKGRPIQEGQPLSIDGTTGEVIEGSLPTLPSEIIQVLVDGSLPMDRSLVYRQFRLLLEWADGIRALGVRTNADTPTDARVARAFGASGIGLCRTEHMFFGNDRIPTVREMILSDTEAERRRALAKLLPMQRQDFLGIFKEMEGLPVTIRLLDPPLHEFLPRERSALEQVASEMGVSVERLRNKVESLHEFNPMLGHRGCRLGITYPEIYEVQVRAIFEAGGTLVREGNKVLPEVMIPLVGICEEYRRLASMVHRVAEQVMRETGSRVPYRTGTMIEIPRACLMAEEIGRHAEFFSFGTNDLTQLGFGFSRDDAGVYLPSYVEQGILPHDPFQSIDREGIGSLVRVAVQGGRKGRADLKIGICGEHGGDPQSIEFFHEAGLDYVSCSPYRVPVARLAAARAALSHPR
ncbi:MAG TPA: pyruvate, phosphate dikinase [Candidatus Polarisedimenticolia bacterium]|jgi:pyruvate,orthophosphate dikinase|nr:pyruvate, phosphate dikinase [Candidatus Polarisedimenticolia bacterium]